jgi:hypothetical protein
MFRSFFIGVAFAALAVSLAQEVAAPVPPAPSVASDSGAAAQGITILAAVAATVAAWAAA